MLSIVVPVCSPAAVELLKDDSIRTEPGGKVDQFLNDIRIFHRYRAINIYRDLFCRQQFNGVKSLIKNTFAAPVGVIGGCRSVKADPDTDSCLCQQLSQFIIDERSVGN